MKVRGAFAVFVGVLSLAAGSAHAQGKPASSAKQFKYKSGKVETGMLYTYVRSDLAGTKEGGVLVYVPDKKRIEILRVNPGESSGQLVTGEMSWDTYSFRQFEIWREGSDGAKTRQATGSFADGALTMTIEDPALYGGAPGATTFSVPLVQVPFHVAGHDFVTLGLALRHFADAGGSADIGVLTQNRSVGPESPNFLVSAGKATVTFEEDVDRDGTSCAKYRIVGPALGDQEGFVWLHKEKGYIQDVEIPVAPGPDWPDVKITLRSAEKISEKDWPLRRSVEISRSPAK